MTRLGLFSSLILRFIFIQGSVSGIRITEVKVPPQMAVGDAGQLLCKWEDDGDRVYALKWYFGIHEFYRWMPLEDPSVKIFPLQEVFSLDAKNSDRGRVRIYNVTRQASGKFRCEISGEAPIFDTSFKTVDMMVAVLPKEPPRLTASKSPHRLNEFVTINCSSVARPAPTLTFYLNDQPVDSKRQRLHPPQVDNITGMATAVLELRFQLQSSMILEEVGGIRVKCVSSLENLYFDSKETILHVYLPNNLPPHLPGYSSQGYASFCVSSRSLVSTLLLLLSQAVFLILLR